MQYFQNENNGGTEWQGIQQLLRVQNTLPLICMSLNKNSIYCVMLRSSENADQRKQWWYRVEGYSAVLSLSLLSLFQSKVAY